MLGWFDVCSPSGLKSWESTEVLPFQKDMIHRFQFHFFGFFLKKSFESASILACFKPPKRRKTKQISRWPTCFRRGSERTVAKMRSSVTLFSLFSASTHQSCRERVKSDLKQFAATKAAAANSARKVLPGTSFSGLKKQLRKCMAIEVCFSLDQKCKISTIEKMQTYLGRKGCSFQGGPNIVATVHFYQCNFFFDV